MRTWIHEPVVELDPAMARLGSTLSDWVAFFTVAGVFAAWLASVVLAESVITTTDQWGRVVWIEDKSVVYYLLHGGALACLLAAGALAAINGGYERLDTLGRLALWVLLSSSLLWTLIAYDWGEMASPAILGATGPFVWFSVLLLFAGMEAEVWRRLGRLFDVLMVVTAVLAIRSMIGGGMQTAGGVYTTNQYFSLLFWYGGWRCLSREYKPVAWLIADVAMLGLLGVLALWLQRRSWVIDTALLVVLYGLGVSRRTHPQDRTRMRRTLAFAGLAGVLLLAGLATTQKAREVASGLRDRLGEDTRSEQYRMFFSQISVEDLVVGLGPKATYYYGPDNPEYQYFDNAYLWMAFIGGLPILASYCVLVVRPGWVAFFRRDPAGPSVAASASMLLIWAIVLAGVGVFCNPSLSATSYFICLMAGLCTCSNTAKSSEWIELRSY